MTTQTEIIDPKTGPAGLVTTFDTGERDLGKRIATGNVTLEDITSGDVTEIGNETLFPNGEGNFAAGFDFNNDGNLMSVEEILKLPDGQEKLQFHLDTVNEKYRKHIEKTNDPVIMFQDGAVGDVTASKTGSDKTLLDRAKGLFGYTSEKNKYHDYVEEKKYIDGVLTNYGGILSQDKLVRQIMVDEFHTGDFFTETKEGFKELARLPFVYAPILARTATDLVAAGMSDDWSETWESGSFDRALFSNSVRKLYSDYLGIQGATQASSLNAKVHKKIQERLEAVHGPEKGKELYTNQYLTTGYNEKGEEVRNPIVLFDDNIAAQLHDYAFNELPGSEKVFRWAEENVFFGALFTLKSTSNAKKMANIVTDVRKNGSFSYKDRKTGTIQTKVIDRKTLDALNDREIEQLYNITQSSNAFTEKFNSITYRIGDAFGARGAALTGANEIKQINVIDDLTNRIDDAYDTISARIVALQKQNKPINTDKIIINARQNIEKLVANRNTQQMNIFGFGVRRSPLMVGNIKDELVVSIGQLAGYNLFDTMGYSPEAGEFFGALSAALKAHKIATAPARMLGSGVDKVSNYTFSQGGSEFMNIVEGVGSIFSGTARRVGSQRPESYNVLKGFFIDGNMKDLADAYFKSEGKRLSTKQRQALQHLVSLTKDMTPKKKGELIEHLRESRELELDIVGAFPPDMQEQVMDTFKESFATASQMPGLIGLEGMFNLKLNVKDVTNFDTKAIDGIITESNRLIKMQDLLVERLTRFSQDGRIDPQNLTTINKYIEGVRRGNQQFKERFANRELIYAESVVLHFNNVMSHPSDIAAQKLDDGILDDVINAFTTIRQNKDKFDLKGLPENIQNLINAPDLVNSIFLKAQEILLKTQKDVRKQLGTAGQSKAIDLLTERLVSLRYNEIFARGKLAYKDVNELSKTIPPMDITDLVGDTLEEFARLNDEPLTAAFSITGSFRRSAHGKRLARTFNNVTGKALVKEFDTDELDQLRQAVHSNKGYVPSNSQLYFILKNSPEDAGLQGNFDLKLEATFFELEEMRRHFRDIGFNLENRNKVAEGSQIMKFSNSIENILSQSEVAYPVLKKARKDYKNAVFLPLDQDQFMTTVRKNIVRDNEDVPSNNYFLKMLENDPNAVVNFQKIYKRGGSPRNYFDNIVNNLTKVTADMSNVNKDAFEDDFENLVRGLGDRFDNGTFGFDLTGTKAVPSKLGEAKFNNLKLLLEHTIYNNWAEMRLSVFDNIMTNPTAIDAAPSKAGFKALSEDLSKRVAIIEDMLTVPVKKLDAEGREYIEQVKLVDLSTMIEKERDIAKYIRLTKQGRDAKTKLDQDFKNFMGDTTKVSKDLRYNTTEFLEVETKIKTALGMENQSVEGFYETLMKHNTPESFAQLRNFFVNGQTIEGVRYPPSFGKEVEFDVALKETGFSTGVSVEEFDNFIRVSYVNGLLKEGQWANSGRYIMGLDGKNYMQKTFQNPLGFIDEFERTNIQGIHTDIFGQKHTDDVNSILKFIKRRISSENYQQLRGVSLGGVIRPISPNEIISRGFNLARGMVSPAYVTAEMLVRLASSNGVDMMKLVLSDGAVADVFKDLITDPKGFDIQRINSIVPVLQSFVFKELAEHGIKDISPMVDNEEFREAFYTTDNVELIPQFQN